MQRWRKWLVLIGVAAVIGLWMVAQPGPAKASAQPPGAIARVNASVQWSHSAYLPGTRGVMALILNIEPDWHIYPGKGSPDEPETYIPTTVNVTLPAGWTQGKIHWPRAEDMLFGPEGAQEQLKVYEGRSIVYVPFVVPADAATGKAQVQVTVGYQACDHSSCEFPTSLVVESATQIVQDAAAITISDDSTLAPQFNAILSEVAAPSPDEPDRSGTSQGAPSDLTPGADLSSAGDTASAVGPGRTFFGIPIPAPGSPGSLVLIALLSALAGFILNLTPCVLPVIPIKIMTIMQHGNHGRRTLVLGLWMAVGVIAFWSALGIPVAFVSGVTDPSRLFGIWWLTLGIGVLIALMGVGILGLFAIQLPQSVYAVNPKADTAWGSFLFGVMTGVLGLPCFGFVAGALLAGVATMPTSMVLTIFPSIGVGMAAPYIVLSARPQLVESLPRTGPASELVKQVMGLLLLAAAAFFIGAGLNALVSDKPYLAHELRNWAVALFCALAGLWLIVRTFQITSRVGPRAVFTITGVIVGGLALLYAIDSTSNARADWLVKQKAMTGGAAGYVHGAWNDWTPAAFDKARAEGNIVVLDFTADWCVNCKVIKATVLNKNPVRSELDSDDVVKFTVDLTSSAAPGNALLASLNQVGIPLLAIYTPGSDEPWMANAYTSQQVIDALEAARSKRTGAAAPGVLRQYSAEAFQQALDSGAVVILSFSAEWDTNSAMLTRRILEKEPVRSELMKPATIAFDVDVTGVNSPGSALLDQLGGVGVPFIAVYGPERNGPLVPASATADDLIRTIATARQKQRL